MNFSRIRSHLIFLFPTLIATYILPFLVDTIRLNLFSGVFARILQKRSLLTAFTYAFVLGTLADIHTYSFPFGFWITNFLLTCFCGWKLSRFFFSDKPHTFVLFSSALSLISSLIAYLFFRFFIGRTLHPSNWISEFMIAPLLDGFSSYLLLQLPSWAYKMITRIHPFIQKRLRVVMGFMRNPSTQNR